MNWDAIGVVESLCVLSRSMQSLQDEAEAIHHPRHDEMGCLYQHYLYPLVRALKPSVIVETGVRTGVSTFYLLSALKKNGSGLLHSCDPAYRDGNALQAIRNAKTPFPEELLEFWKFYGQSSAELFSTLDVEPSLFVHDSDHSAANMTFELDWAWEALMPGGVLVVDDFEGDWNRTPHRAFHEFVEKAGVKWYKLHAATAILRKPLP